ncbi:unnamed protein product [Tilletia laevis]|uniref:Uncharacterized protein n=1 Tax=Tilletia caries TaxID=13290 RepID=A0A177UAF4_9BASI|nr:hypothetical protein CF336_g8217 [Tilletia laevis]KAE8250313.1 hypothetical protein A4X03_0g6466 [Tilletia caries]CAD6960968.1 unnamed protein product [Tilletia controversa]CAD6886770.1 unnamed protein product [Tilletia caries]CAD6924002.1 unnamed protein product [Tilletia caries]
MSFKVLNAAYSGDTFANNCLDVIRDFGIETKWARTLTTDSSGGSLSMAQVLEEKFASQGQGEGTMSSEAVTPAAAFSTVLSAANLAGDTAAEEPSTWASRHCVGPSMPHQLEIAIQAGFCAMRIEIVTQEKVMPTP